MPESFLIKFGTPPLQNTSGRLLLCFVMFSVDFHIKGLPVKHVDYCSLVELTTDKIPI